ncbi:MAG: pyridoxamine 5'-phosphate oxidase family protein, partial [Sphingobacterium sp.]
WFIMSKLSYKDDEIKNDPLVHLLFQSGKRSGLMNLYGIAEIVEDQFKIEALWNPAIAIWFDGPHDPQIGLIRVEVLEGHYWDEQSAAPIAAFKMLKSLLTGKHDHDGIQGDLNI